MSKCTNKDCTRRIASLKSVILSYEKDIAELEARVPWCLEHKEYSTLTCPVCDSAKIVQLRIKVAALEKSDG